MKILKLATGVILFFNGLWSPFWINSQLPEKWMGSHHWWSFPMGMTLLIYGSAMTIGGLYWFVRTLSEPKQD